MPFQAAAETEANFILPELEERHDAESAPLHLFLNGVLSAFKRAQFPISLSKRYLRFFQNFAASNPGEAVSLLQAEALLSPSIFFNQLADGSFTGALPYFLFGDKQDNHLFGFQSFHEHVLARITNPLAPHLEVNSNGLFLKTCSVHTDLLKKIVHVPTSPLGNLLQTHCDRLAPLTTKARNATSLTVGNFSHTYTMATSKGGFEGISSLQITSARHFNIKSDYLLPNSETLFSQNRVDVRNLLIRLLNDNEISQSFLNSLVSVNLPVPDDVLQQHISTGSSLTFFALSSIKYFLDKNDNRKLSIPAFLLILHPDFIHGAPPEDACRFLFHRSLGVTLIVFLQSNLEFFGDLLLQNINSQNLLRCSNLLPRLHSNRRHLNSPSVDSTLTEMQVFHAIDLCRHNLLTIVTQVFDRTDSCLTLHLSARGLLRYDICDLYPSLDSPPLIMIAIVYTDNNNNRRCEIPLSITTQKGSYSLVVVTELNLSNAAFRYSGRFPGWWHVSFPSFILRKEDVNVIDQFSRNWNVVIYLTDSQRESREQSLMFFGGQEVFKCSKHLLPLSVDMKSSSFVCRIARCKNMSAWRCPKDSCSSSLCNHHFKTLSQVESSKFIDPMPSTSSSVCLSEEENLSDTDTDISFPPMKKHCHRLLSLEFEKQVCLSKLQQKRKRTSFCLN